MRQRALELRAAKWLKTKKYFLARFLGSPSDSVKSMSGADTSPIGFMILAGDLLLLPIGHFGITNPLD